MGRSSRQAVSDISWDKMTEKAERGLEIRTRRRDRKRKAKTTRPSVRVHWVACGTCTVPNNFFQGH